MKCVWCGKDAQDQSITIPFTGRLEWKMVEFMDFDNETERGCCSGCAAKVIEKMTAGNRVISPEKQVD